ncbi:unnamed protein product [Psylliodes chrysocephalus]|uniref:Uncharacterized protein n=1 Tax=Psylliodes chrysocephalus TaxID=3402493 RepID=A0A9P0CPQ5_9CUCU|nr:unnamed protein product [Psylliodes chrysocephala]
MSFGKAKRFNYKCPDLQVSPADYYICSSFEKSCTISKSPRFPLKQDGQFAVFCSRKNCRCSEFKERHENFSRYSGSSNRSYGSGPSQASTPYRSTRNLNSTDLDKMKEKIMLLNKEDIQRFPFGSPGKSSADSENTVKNLVHKYENLPKYFNIWTSEEFIDDDYHSYTSSDELDHFQKMEFFNNKEIKRHVDDREKFEYIIIEKMDKIGKIIENFQENLSGLKEKVDRNELINREHRCSKYTNSVSDFRQDTSVDIKDIIFKAIENLRKEFESKQHSILSDTIEKLKDLAKDIHTAKQSSAKKTKHICEKTASVLYNDIMDYIDKNDTLEFETSQNYDKVMADESFDHPDFNYENICQILSDHLQVSQRELDDLKKEKMDVTIKFVDTEEKLKTQTSVIDKLHEEIIELKKTC